MLHSNYHNSFTTSIYSIFTECDALACGDICMNLGNNRGQCSCRQGFYLLADDRSCTGNYSTSKQIISTASSLDMSSVPYEEHIG